MQLISYIAPSAPATRRPATGEEPFLRPEIGFTPQWYHRELGIDFGERWHIDPRYRGETVVAMRSLLCERFTRSDAASRFAESQPLDLLTGVFGACTVAGLYGLGIQYAADGWPVCEEGALAENRLAQIEPPDLADNAFFRRLLSQVDWIAAHRGRVTGYINWQGVLNNAMRLRGQRLYIDMAENPLEVRRLFDAVCTTMIEAAGMLYERQKRTGETVRFFTVSNCLVNMISPEMYAGQLLVFDQRIARKFGCIGVHNCAWNADPYLAAYARIPHVAYIDMSMDSDLRRARTLFPAARRAIMYPPTDVADKSTAEIGADLERIARDYGPCDIVAADIDVNTPDDKVHALLRWCEEISSAEWVNDLQDR